MLQVNRKKTTGNFNSETTKSTALQRNPPRDARGRVTEVSYSDAPIVLRMQQRVRDTLSSAANGEISAACVRHTSSVFTSSDTVTEWLARFVQFEADTQVRLRRTIKKGAKILRNHGTAQLAASSNEQSYRRLCQAAQSAQRVVEGLKHDEADTSRNSQVLEATRVKLQQIKSALLEKVRKSAKLHRK